MFEEAGTTRDAVDAVVEWPRRPGPLRRHRRDAAPDAVQRRRVLQLRARDARRSSAPTSRSLVIDASEGFTVGGQEDREPRDGRRASLPARREQVGPGRGEGPARTRSCRRRCRPFARRDGRCGPRPLNGQGVHRLPPVLIDLHARWTAAGPDLEGERGDPAGAARATDAARSPATSTTRPRWAPGPPSFVIFGGATRTRRRLPALPREPAAADVRARGRADPADVPPAEARRAAKR